jgi:N6-adenosine-specific RNA methylase IME4
MTTEVALVPSIPKAIAMLTAMEAELTNASTYEQINDVIRRASALRVLFKEVEDVERQAQLTIVLGKRRIGEELKKVPKATGKNLPRVGDSKASTGIKHSERSRLGKLASVPESVIRETSARLQQNGRDATVNGVLQELTYQNKKQTRTDKLDRLAAKALPQQLFNVAIVDPPWRTETWSDKGKDRSADNHYATMSLDEIKALGVSALMAKSAMIGLWITVPFVGVMSEILDAWEFEFKSMLTWDKDIPGTGKWFMNQTEHLVIATRGDFPAPLPGTQISSLYRERRTRHSAKPEAILEWIDSIYPDVPKIELFRRGAARPGWSAWGNESGDTDE